jgi:tRNA pseudouridine38-40 synthase
MDGAAVALVGRHDFSAFGGKHEQPIRTLYGVRVRRKGREVTIDVAGDAFLRQMVRSIVAALLRIGHGTATMADLEAALRSPDRVFAGQVAPPHGLSLRRVVLGGDSPVSIGKARG